MTPPWAVVTGEHDALGHRFGIRCSDPVVGSTLVDAFAPLATGGASTQWYSVLVDGERGQLWWRGVLLANGSVRHLGPALRRHLDQAVIDACAPSLAFHGTAVARNGTAMLVLGASGAARAAVVERLATDGSTPLTDGLTVVEPSTLAVRPFHRPDLDDLTAAPAAAAPGPRLSGAGPVTVGAVVVLADEPRADPARVEPLTGATAVAHLGGHAVNLQGLGVDALDGLIRMTEAVPCHLLTADGPAATADLLAVALAPLPAPEPEPS